MTTRKVALVTGGARGIGAACARTLATAGYDVAISYRSRADEADAVCKAVEAAGGRALAVKADAASEAETLALFAAVDEAFGRLDALVNNAGVTSPPAPLADTEADAIKRVLDVNLYGAILAAREAVRRMSTARGGAGGGIVNFSSGAARHGSPGEYVHYAASKAALEALTVGLAREVAGEGIRVNAVAPGIIDTDIHADQGQDDKVARLVPQVPLGRPGTAAEIAEPVVWLLSDAAAYVTGTTLVAAGGR